MGARVSCEAAFPLTQCPSPAPALDPYTPLFRSVRTGITYPPGGEQMKRFALSAAVLGVLVGIVLQPGAARYPREHRSGEHTSELQSRFDTVCRLLLERKKF